jgi:hypothetical protein
MDSSRLLALPPELRMMIYAYLRPYTIAHTRDYCYHRPSAIAHARRYCGLRQTYRFLQNDYDGELLRLLRRAYQHTNPGYSFTLSGLDMRNLELKI